MKRCAFVPENDPLYQTYHDNEWGQPKHDDTLLFELLVLESFQSGLSWSCILHKRQNFRIAFDQWNLDKILHYDEKKINELLSNKEIIRNRAKILAVIQNARVFCAIQKEYGSFDAYIWNFTQGKTIQEDYRQTSSPLSQRISQDLKDRGMKFVGPTILYSYLQAIGILDPHGPECDLYQKDPD